MRKWERLLSSDEEDVSVRSIVFWERITCLRIEGVVELVLVAGGELCLGGDSSSGDVLLEVLDSAEVAAVTMRTTTLLPRPDDLLLAVCCLSNADCPTVLEEFCSGLSLTPGAGTNNEYAR